MDEMNNMNEVAIEETSNEVTPVVAENNEVHEEAKKLGINPVLIAGGAAALAAGGYVVNKTAKFVGNMITAAKEGKNDKKEKKVKAEKKTKGHLVWQPPVKFVKDEPVEETVDDSAVEETEEEN